MLSVSSSESLAHAMKGPNFMLQLQLFDAIKGWQIVIYFTVDVKIVGWGRGKEVCIFARSVSAAS